MYDLLLVDDEAIVRMGVKTCIDWEKHNIANVYEASNGHEALVILEKHPIAIMISDIKMAGMDGIELLRALDQLPYKPEIIIMSCYNDFETMRSIMQLGARDFLFKPKMYPDDIELVIQKTLKQIERTAGAQKTLAAPGVCLDVIGPDHDQEAIRLLLDELETDQAMTLTGAKNLTVNLIVRLIYLYGDSPVSQDLLNRLTLLHQCTSVNKVAQLLKTLVSNLDVERSLAGQDKILSAVHFIEQNLTSQNLSMEMAAAHVELSPSYFSRLFKSIVGCSYTRYVTDKRIKLAEYLYQSTNLKVYEIAQSVGYTSTRYFSKLYKRHRGKGMGLPRAGFPQSTCEHADTTK